MKKKNFIGFEEKPQYNFLLNIGFYLINKKELKLIKKNQKMDMNEFILLLNKRNKKIGVYQIEDLQWQDFGNWQSFYNLKSNSKLLK